MRARHGSYDTGHRGSIGRCVEILTEMRSSRRRRRTRRAIVITGVILRITWQSWLTVSERSHSR
jgi:hypothetical protein